MSIFFIFIFSRVKKFHVKTIYNLFDLFYFFLYHIFDKRFDVSSVKFFSCNVYKVQNQGSIFFIFIEAGFLGVNTFLQWLALFDCWLAFLIDTGELEEKPSHLYIFLNEQFYFCSILCVPFLYIRSIFIILNPFANKSFLLSEIFIWYFYFKLSDILTDYITFFYVYLFIFLYFILCLEIGCRWLLMYMKKFIHNSYVYIYIWKKKTVDAFLEKLLNIHVWIKY